MSMQSGDLDGEDGGIVVPMGPKGGFGSRGSVAQGDLKEIAKSDARAVEIRMDGVKNFQSPVELAGEEVILTQWEWEVKIFNPKDHLFSLLTCYIYHCIMVNFRKQKRFVRLTLTDRRVILHEQVSYLPCFAAFT